MGNSIKKFFQIFMAVAISGLLLWWIYTKIDVQKIVEAVKVADTMYIFYAFVVFMLVNVFMLWRWMTFIKALGLDSPNREIVRYFFIGLFGNLFLPSAVGGDAIKILGLCKTTKQKAKVVASIFLDRVTGYAGIVLIACLAFIFGYKYAHDTGLALPLLIIFLVTVMIITIFFNQKLFSIFFNLFKSWPKIKTAMESFHENVLLMHDKKMQGLGAIGISVVSQLVYAACFYLLAKAFHHDASIIYFLIFVPLTCMAAAIPSIGGLGVREVGTVYLFSKIGIPQEVSVSISLMIFVFMVAAGLIGAFVYVVTLSSRRVQHSSSNS